MNRMLVALTLLTCGALTMAPTKVRSRCGDNCTATLAMAGDTLVLHGADVPYHTKARRMTLKIKNDTGTEVSVVLRNFQVYTGDTKTPKCPGVFGLGSAAHIKLPDKKTESGVAPCESPTVPIAGQGGTQSIGLKAILANGGERYKFDLVASRSGKPDAVFDPEIIIDQTLVPGRVRPTR